ncbi:MAG: hypothetical protein C5B54_07575 [Acidobacteria bacterium]|nr:MAG: hypothetical protein C5B54_07575 [Acidobacteriota bacterium]
MKINKNEIRLSTGHPSLLVQLQPQTILYSPIVVNEKGELVDGYRRFQIESSAEMNVVSTNINPVIRAAYAFNQRTRQWDEAECFLWQRWARISNHDLPELSHTRFDDRLFSIDQSLLSAMAIRHLTIRQVLLILDAPIRYRPFLTKLFTETITLNANEMAVFIDMSCDLIHRLGVSTIQALFEEPSLAAILAGGPGQQKQTGERLLKQMRSLRYPYYQRKSEQLEASWTKLRLAEDFQLKKHLLLERGILEISFQSASAAEFREKAGRLFQSLESRNWDDLWQEE